MRNKQFYFDKGAEAARTLNTPEEGYPTVWDGIDIGLNGSWQAVAWRAGYDSQRGTPVGLSSDRPAP